MPLIECVPNFSDGRDPALAADLRAVLEGVRGVHLLGWHSDVDHNRSVATLVGEPAALAEAALAAIALAAERIDLRAHEGVHPRLGATDVCPFVPLAPDDEAACVAAAHGLGERVARELGLPVYFYGAAARTPERRALPDVRRGGFEGLARALEQGTGRAPDAGPSRLHPTAGAVAIGVRGFLIAFNVELETRDLAVARAVAREVRESSGGLPGVRALGLPLPTRGRVQVSMNLIAPERTGLVAAFEAVRRGAEARGVKVHRSELVGLAPRAHLDVDVARRAWLPDLEPRRDVLEEALAAAVARAGGT